MGMGMARESVLCFHDDGDGGIETARLRDEWVGRERCALLGI